MARAAPGTRFIVIAVLLLVRATSAAAQSTTKCDAANPYDMVPDHLAIQSCVDQFDRVLLSASARGYVGYVVGEAIDLRRNGVLLTSADAPRKAVLVASTGLAEPLLRAAANSFEISFVVFDGSAPTRSVRSKPCNEARDYRNVSLSGAGFRIRYVESTRAVCGAGMTVGGSSRFEISNSWFYDNGRQPEDADGLPGLWADGLNVFNCTGATIRDNRFWDNTDVDLGVNGGPGCAVYRNTIEHFHRYAFAGLVAGDPSRQSGEFSDNHVTSAPNRLGLGIVVGCHPWFQCGGGYARNLLVHDNTVSGAVVNLVVDGLNGGTVERNRMHGAQGNRVMNCLPPADYIAAHVIDVRLQSGYTVRTADFMTSCPP